MSVGAHIMQNGREFCNLTKKAKGIILSCVCTCTPSVMGAWSMAPGAMAPTLH